MTKQSITVKKKGVVTTILVDSIIPVATTALALGALIIDATNISNGYSLSTLLNKMNPILATSDFADFVRFFSFFLMVVGLSNLVWFIENRRKGASCIAKFIILVGLGIALFFAAA